MAQYTDITIPSGSTFNNATIKGFGNVAFKDAPQNQFDIGMRSAPNGSYKILAVVDRSKEDTAPFAQPMNISGFSVKIGTIVNIQLTKNVTATIPTEMIIMTDNAGNTGSGNTSTNNAPNGNTKFVWTPAKKVVGALLAIGAVLGILKLTKVI